jgi:threonine aldolase
MIDLRSDTVTLPTEEMRAAMARAEVGDDVYGEDPTVRRLEDAAAAAMGKEAAVFVPSGVMGNLLAIKCHTRPGDEVIAERRAHVVEFEMGGMAWFSGVMPRVLDGRHHLLDPEEVRGALRVQVPYYVARSGLVCVENTSNFGGGRVYAQEALAGIYRVAAEAGVPVHLDGARIFNAAVVQGIAAREIARHADTVMFSFSKGLSAPVGSALCGPAAFIEEARRVRRVLGGGMRQAGFLAAAALVGLETMVERLAEDHRMARRLAEGLAQIPELGVDLAGTETNMVVCRPSGGAEAAKRIVQGLKERGVLVSQLSAETVRLVTHRHIGYNEVDFALSAFASLRPLV